MKRTLLVLCWLSLVLGGCINQRATANAILCFRQQDSSVIGYDLANRIAIGNWVARDEWKTWRSDDGGLTWRIDNTVDQNRSEMSPCKLELVRAGNQWVPRFSLLQGGDSTISFLFRQSNGVFRSTDRGVTYVRELEQSVPAVDCVKHSPTGNWIVTAGSNQVWVRSTQGEWKPVLVTQ